ncbi:MULTISPECIES: NAD+ synthase [unclassified Streptomyces]|uniref:Glutamine-dependent NAD(+) synthetase n=1 Tax=Streptomyces flavovirens TaxID=52258 RepID=A0ABV8N4A4_9ACTN|nr:MULTISPECIES: NAD+ synthase [unclassified Streptomyces]MYR70163.1 NAD+ synthase [Streptomyces sp. SID4939]MYS04475.1 NAD+ synthase [Streptomyces sp. SID4940]MYT64547.1 NAD+ synthase [Streptomyces sp. SID8357]MYT87360.1 NAD+ synthase [Streptomyces sp. SID8360]MYU34812.1 NAD+ synthase [Streptomyces sp. SID8358]MYW37077.1 NAD+ synthase [Streptomyces sp. SID1]MYX75771.1 NAD+ synthase [Streptomyces sp. SID3915]
MPQLRLALNQIDSTVGDLAGNSESVVHWTRHAAEQGAHLVAFPEMVLTGYPVEDLALRSSFVEASRRALRALAARLADEGFGELPVVVGYLDRSEHTAARYGQPAGSPRNAAAVLHRGEVALNFAKHHLPNYGVFDEFRYFVPGDSMPVVRVHGIDVALAICEDLWQEGGRVPAARAAGAGLLLSINASPYERDKDDTRLELVRKRAQEAGCTTAYLAMMGGQDELVFDGDSIVVDKDGEVLARAPQFSEGSVILDLDLPAAAAEVPSGIVNDELRIDHVVLSDEPLPAYEPELAGGYAQRLDDDEELYSALVVGLRAYAAKNGFRSVLIGLSGGIDSALVAAIACDALGPENVYGVSMPSKYSSDHSKGDAAELARRTGLNYRTVSIEAMFDAYMGELGLTGLAEENLQSRLRGTTLMAISNQEGQIVLAPGNKSELAVGYSTLYGDSVGAYGPIKDVYKTSVFRLAKWRNRAAEERGQTPPIPEASITKPPSAELRPDQVDTDSLPDYDVLDRILELYVDRDQGRDAIVAAGFDAELVTKTLRMVDTAEYKRRQYPPGTKISPKGFGKDRRLPITNRWRESD